MEAQLADGSVWLAQHEIARLFGGFSATVCNNLRAISKSGVLFEKHVSRRFPAGTKYSDTFCNLEAFIFLSFRCATIERGSSGNGCCPVCTSITGTTNLQKHS